MNAAAAADAADDVTASLPSDAVAEDSSPYTEVDIVMSFPD